MTGNQLIIKPRRVSTRVPSYCWFLCRDELKGEFISAAKQSNIEARQLPEAGELELGHGDFVYVDLEAVTSNWRPVIEDIARLGCEEIGLVFCPCVFTLNRQEEDIPTLSECLDRSQPAGSNPIDSWITEYQLVLHVRPDQALFSSRVGTLNEMNSARIRAAMVTLGSLPYMAGSVLFGGGNFIYPVIAAIFLWFNWWRAAHVPVTLLCHFVTAAVVLRQWHGRGGSASSITWRVALMALTGWLASKEGLAVEYQLVAAALGLLVHHIWERSRDWMDQWDLLRAAFSRDLDRSSPEMRPPENMPAIGSQEYVLWRLFHFPVIGTFAQKRLGSVFVSHRSSVLGNQVALKLETELKREQFKVFLDRSDLQGGLSWRDQLLHGLIKAGYLVCALTREPDELSYKWIRRELFAACLSYRRYGTPIPIIVEAGYTLDEFLETEEANGHFDTPIHRVRSRISTMVIDDADDIDDLFRLELIQEMRARAAQEILFRQQLILPHLETVLPKSRVN
ncbi:MAG: toll/interleukin-1 receptor domain-containing protein [Planctomycetaceae bacterium]